MNGMLRMFAPTVLRKCLLTLAALVICSFTVMATPPSDQSTPPAEKVMVPFKFQPHLPKSFVPESNIAYVTDMTSQERKDSRTRNGFIVNYSYNIPKTENCLVAKAPMREEEETSILSVNLKYNKEEIFRVMVASAYPTDNSEYKVFHPRFYEGTPDVLDFELPNGSYDIEVIMQTLDMDIILLSSSDINIANDRDFTLNAADATVEIEWNPLLSDGSVPFIDTPIYSDDYSEIIDIVPGNVLSKSYQLTIKNKYNPITSASISYRPFPFIVDNVRYLEDAPRIRTIPDNNYKFELVTSAIGINGGNLISLSADDHQSEIVKNNVNDYITLKPEFATTPHQPKPQIIGEGDNQIVVEFDKNKGFYVLYATVVDGELIGITSDGVISLEQNLKQEIHVCQNPENNNGYLLMPIPALMEDFDANYKITCLPINTTLTPYTILAWNNVSNLGGYRSCTDNRTLYMKDLTNPWLSFDMTKQHVWNYGCPVLVSSATESEWGSYFNFTYIGRVGENRSIDLLSTVTQVSVNDAAPSDEILDNLQWGKLPEEGKIDFEIIDTNVEIGGISGKNVARVGFDMSRKDWQPPTLQTVRFVDTEDNFTDRYSTGKDGVIEFYGGDFTNNYNPENYVSWYTEVPATEVKVEYAPYGTDLFQPLEVEKIPEKDFMPGFGTYYRGSLAAVDRKSENGWFDVRITLTDAAGNYQEQTLSPAFRIEDCVGIESTTAPEIGVSVANGNITVCGCENPIVEVYSAAGMMIRRVNGNQTNASGLGHGIYLVKVTDGTKKVVRKVSM